MHRLGWIVPIILGAVATAWVAFQFVSAFLRTSEVNLLINGAGFFLLLLMFLSTWLIKASRLDQRLGLGLLGVGCILSMALVTYPLIQVGNLLAIAVIFAFMLLLGHGKLIGALVLVALFTALAWLLVTLGWMSTWVLWATLLAVGLTLLGVLVSKLMRREKVS